jgi:hypothetical protein
MSLKECMVCMVGKGGQTYETTIEATSLFDAADRALRQWALLWWYRPGAVVEVRLDGQCWKVRAARVIEWRSKSGPVDRRISLNPSTAGLHQCPITYPFVDLSQFGLGAA